MGERTWSGYQASRVLNLLSTGSALPEIEEIVLSELQRLERTVKREELVEAVAAQTKICKDEVAANINPILSHLEKENKVKHVDHGYWVAAR